MKLVTFRGNGEIGFGVVDGAGIIDLRPRLDGRYGCLREALAPEGLAAIAEAMVGATPDFGLEDVTLLPPVPDPGKIICIGVNYEDHRLESGRAKAGHPTIFTRFADTQVGHQGALMVPSVSDLLDFEGELAVTIGKGGRHIARSRAAEHVAGYSCFNDASVRDWQRHTSQFIPGKNFPATGGSGPWLVSADEIADIEASVLETRLNGAVMQRAKIGEMVFPIADLIAYISAFTPLKTGDMIVTGTPAGVGILRDPPLLMKAGDEIVVEIDKVGCLINHVEAESCA